MLKRFTVIAILLAVFSLAVVPDIFAHGRCRRAGYRTAYYGSPYYRTAYYGSPYYRTTYYGSPYYSTGYYGRRYYSTGYYSPYRYSGVAGSRYYYGRRRNSTRNALLRIGAPAAVGGIVGALLGGGKGAAVGALLGGGGGAVYHFTRGRRRY